MRKEIKELMAVILFFWLMIAGGCGVNPGDSRPVEKQNQEAMIDRQTKNPGQQTESQPREQQKVRLAEEYSQLTLEKSLLF